MKKALTVGILILSLFMSGCTNSEDVDNLKKTVASLEEAVETKNEKISELEDVLDKLIEDLDNNQSAKRDVSPSNDVVIRSVSDQGFSYVTKDADENIYNICIVASNVDELDEFETIHVNGPGTGEILKIQVVGNIYDFQVVELRINESDDSIVEGEILKEISKISNKIILLDTYLACGIPLGMLKWKNRKGEIFEYSLGQDGFGFNGEILLCK